MPSEYITFIASHQPPLKDGLHTLTLEHTLAYGDAKQTFKKTHTIFVRGERFALRPDHIHKVFPPANAVGDFDSVLPHVVLSRKTLPWERTPATPLATPPTVPSATAGPTQTWLAVLVFDKEQAPKLVSGKVSDLQKSSLNSGTYSYGSVYDPLLQPGSGEALTDGCAYIDIPSSLFNASAPTLDDLLWNAHARKRDHDYAVVIGTQLCPPGTTAVAHLVSLEGLGGVLPKADGTPQLPADITTVRLVSLKSWSFRVLPLQESFDAILHGLNQGGSADTELLLPAGVMPDIPQVVNTARLDEGFTMLGESAATAAAYRGPLIPWGMASPTWPSELPSLPVDHAEQLSDKTNNDESYSAAWQLGRLLALADKGYAVEQVGWKRDLRLKLNAALARDGTLKGSSRAAYAAAVRAVLADPSAEKGIQFYLGSTLTTDIKETSGVFIPQSLVGWLQGLALLKGVPFHYLVPDARMLPPESIRFFNVDGNWLDALLDGAWSLGREKVSEWGFDTAFQPWRDAKVARPRSGLLIQSRLISGYWPGIVFERDKGVPIPREDLLDEKDRDELNKQGGLTILREDRLGPTTLLVLFNQPFQTGAGQFNTLTIQEPPEGSHFGFDAEDKDGVLTLSKTLRDMTTGKETVQTVTDIPFRPYSNVLDLAALATSALKVADASQFALQMVQKTPQVKFNLSA